MKAAFAVIAVDDGPRACCAPLLAVPGFIPLEGREPRQIHDLAASGCRVLVCGTSDSDRGREIEAAARRAAHELRMRLVALEDYPGNYSDVAGGEADLLVVESEIVARLHRARLAGRCPQTVVCPAPRYDAYRREARQLRARYARRDPAARSVLWAGQPETADALATLQRIVQVLGPLRPELLFRAHPRDAGYRAGAYRNLFSGGGIKIIDVSARPLGECFALGPELVVTQFSSVAVEAGFHGIPSVHFLYPDIGGKTLLRKKGYGAPPCCEAGASFLIQARGGEASALQRALADSQARESAIAAFDRYYSTSRESLSELLAHLYNQ